MYDAHAFVLLATPHTTRDSPAIINLLPCITLLPYSPRAFPLFFSPFFLLPLSGKLLVRSSLCHIRFPSTSHWARSLFVLPLFFRLSSTRRFRQTLREGSSEYHARVSNSRISSRCVAFSYERTTRVAEAFE